MLNSRIASAIAAATLLSMASADGSSSSKIVSIPTPTATVPANAMSEIGCFATGVPLEDHGVGDFMSPGSCQQICLGLEKDVLGLSDGTNCWCGDLIPPKSSQVGNETCNTSCSGTDKVMCGGKKKLWVVLTGLTRNDVDYFEPEASSSASASAAPQTSAGASTVIETATDTPSSAPANNGPNKAGIAAGVVVGVIGLAAIIGGVVFWLRQKRRREVEEDYRRQAANVNSFVAGGKLHTSNSSMTDSRLDPEFTHRRQSNGSIADNEDYSRRILKVTNA